MFNLQGPFNPKSFYVLSSSYQVMAIEVIGNLKIPYIQPLLFSGQIWKLENRLKKRSTCVIGGIPHN